MNSTLNLKMALMPLTLRSYPLLSAATALLAFASTGAAQSLHLDVAVELVDQITTYQANGIFTDGNGVSLNRYGGSWNSNSDPSFVRLEDLENGILPGNNTKCSPLVTHLLRNLHGWNWSDHPFYDPIEAKLKTSVSPQAYQYCALIKQEIGFDRVPTLDAALPGDILSWWVVGSSSSDHTMIIQNIDWSSAKPYPLGYANSNPALAGTTYYEVRVVDSSSDTHTDDTRLVDVNGSIEHIDGIGTGTIGLLVNPNFEIIGRTWSLPTSNYDTQKNTWVKSLNSRLKLAPTWEIVVGRFQQP